MCGGERLEYLKEFNLATTVNEIYPFAFEGVGVVQLSLRFYHLCLVMKI